MDKDFQPRKNAADRGYDNRWQKFRKHYLAKHPLCVKCGKLGLTVLATVVDHIEPHRGDMELFWRKGNHQGLCEQCHNVAKRIEEIRGVEIGCGVDGLPLDARHRWNKR